LLPKSLNTNRVISVVDANEQKFIWAKGTTWGCFWKCGIWGVVSLKPSIWMIKGCPGVTLNVAPLKPLG